MSLIEVEHFSYSYPGETEPVLQDINLKIEPGSFVVICGKSGSGKSTLGKALAGFLFQDEIPNFSGKIRVNGADMTKLPIYKACEYVAYVQQNPEDQFCTLTVQDEIAFGLENHCVEPEHIEHRIHQVLEIVQGQNLKNRNLSSLSGGEKQKVAIASLLALEPDVLILDEPTSNLDPIATRHVFESLYQLRKKRELTIIIIEHKLTQLIPLNPEFYKIEKGEIFPLKNIETPRFEARETSAPISMDLTSKEEMDAQVIHISNMNVNIGSKPILNNIELQLKPGEFVALMGPNGSGKSTLLETIMGFHPLQSGKCVVFNNAQPKKNTSALVNETGYIFQNPDHQLFTQSVWDEAVFTSSNLEILNENKKAQAQDWLVQMSLEQRNNDHPQKLSYGEKRRLNLIAAMLHSPRLLLIDELLIGQDLDNAHKWMSILYDYAKKGGAVVLVNHHPDLTQSYCSRIIFLNQGSIVVDKPVSEAFQDLAVLGYDAFLPSERLESIYA